MCRITKVDGLLDDWFPYFAYTRKRSLLEQVEHLNDYYFTLFLFFDLPFIMLYKFEVSGTIFFVPLFTLHPIF